MGVAFSLFAISAAVLASQVLLMRLFSITQWHHFSYMIISVALLGFGASGSFITVFRKRLLKSSTFYYRLFAALFTVSLPAVIIVAQSVPFDPFLIIWDTRQYFYLLVHYLLLFIPFFFGAACIGLLFTGGHERIGNLYFVNLLGSGAGALAAVLLMNLLPVENLLAAVSICGLASLAATYRESDKREWMYIVVPALVFVVIFTFKPVVLNVSQYKDLSRALDLPDAEVAYESDSPLGRLTVVESSSIRMAPGLSTAFTGVLPSQHALFFDAASPTAINEWNGTGEPPEYLDYLPGAAVYSVKDSPDVLIIGLGGGSELLSALRNGASGITVIERDERIKRLLDDSFAEYSGGILSRPQVRVRIGDGRGFLRSEEGKHDLIIAAVSGSYSAASTGVTALGETYLYTVEAMKDALKRLEPEGILSLTGWLKHPPRDNLKLLLTVAEALEEEGMLPAADRIFFFKGWGTATVLAKNEPFSSEELAALKAFCEERFFDLIHYTGMTRDEANRFNRFDEPVYFDAAADLLGKNVLEGTDADTRGEFIETYPFNLSPARDDRPYFNHLFKLEAAPHLLRTMGVEWIPFIEWGYIILMATLVQAAVVGTGLILVPLFFLKRVEKKSTVRSGGSLNVLLYFSFIGFGFMFVEIVLMQKFTLFLAEPVYSVAVTLGALLFWSGIGSRLSDDLAGRFKKPLLIITGFIAASLLLGIILLDHLFDAAAPAGIWAKTLITAVILAPIGIAMGMPFPLWLKRLGKMRPEYVPWAWGVNGCASVVGAVLAMMLAVSWGFSAVLLIAGGLYIAAGVVAVER